MLHGQLLVSLRGTMLVEIERGKKRKPFFSKPIDEIGRNTTYLASVCPSSRLLSLGTVQSQSRSSQCDDQLDRKTRRRLQKT